jgi:hypothetical protein
MLVFGEMMGPSAQRRMVWIKMTGMDVTDPFRIEATSSSQVFQFSIVIVCWWKGECELLPSEREREGIVI